MIFWLSNGEGPGGGVSITNRLLFGGGGVDCEIKILQGGGVAEEMTGLPKNCPAPPADK